MRKYTAGLMPLLRGDEMENVLDSALFQEELRFYGLDGNDVHLIRSKEGVIVARVRWGDGTAVLKCFENTAFRREIQNYDILHSCDIQTITVLGKSDHSILLEDIDSSETYRLGIEQDLNNPSVIKAIAKWYKTLHTNGRQYVQHYGAGMYEEWDFFTMDNIMAILDNWKAHGGDHNPNLQKPIEKKTEYWTPPSDPDTRINSTGKTAADFMAEARVKNWERENGELPSDARDPIVQYIKDFGANPVFAELKNHPIRKEDDLTEALIEMADRLSDRQPKIETAG